MEVKHINKSIIDAPIEIERVDNTYFRIKCLDEDFLYPDIEELYCEARSIKSVMQIMREGSVVPTEKQLDIIFSHYDIIQKFLTYGFERWNNISSIFTDRLSSGGRVYCYNIPWYSRPKFNTKARYNSSLLIPIINLNKN